MLYYIHQTPLSPCDVATVEKTEGQCHIGVVVSSMVILVNNAVLNQTNTTAMEVETAI